MNEQLLSKWRAYILSQGAPRGAKGDKALRAITISRETGAGAVTVGQMLSDYLEANQPEGRWAPWAVCDRELVKMVLKEHQLPADTARYMPEDGTNRVTDVVEEILGLHPSSWTLVQHTNHTILRLARTGNVILVGRGSHLITAGLRHVLHVRLVAPRDFRIRHIQDYFKLSKKEATEFVLQGDRAKSRYLQMNFESKSQDSLLFHLTINTGRVSFEAAAQIIGNATLNMRVGQTIEH